jgi:hypothetical protein
MTCPLLWMLGDFWGETTGPVQYKFMNHFTISNGFIVAVA